jgi:hypothetical protein
MSNCGQTEFLRGGTLDAPKIIDATIYGGEANDLILDNAELRGSLTLDPDVTLALAQALSPHLTLPLDADATAGVFKNCDDLPLIPDTKIVTCANLDASLTLFKANVEADLATFADDWDDKAVELENKIDEALDPTRLVNQLISGNDLPLIPGSKVPLWSEMETYILTATAPTEIAKVFRNSEGLDLAPGTELMSKTEVEELVALKICEGCANGGGGGGVGGMAITSMAFDSLTNTLTIVEADDENSNTWDAVITGSAPVFTESPVIPDTDTDDHLPTTLVGDRSALLGEPALWLGPFNLNGKYYVIPAFEVEAPSFPTSNP